MTERSAPILRPVMRVKTRGIHGDHEIPRPTYAGPSVTPGPYPDRILLLGNGALAGWGVASHDEAVPGHLARALTARTDHAAEVHLVMDHTITVETVDRLADGVDLTDFDAIVLVVGASDALQLLAVRRWTAAIQAVLHLLGGATGTSTDVIVIGIQPPSTVPVFDLTPGGLVDRRAVAFNEVTQAICTGRFHFLMPPVLSRIGPSTADATRASEEAVVSAGYRDWAEAIADCLVGLRPRNPDADAEPR